jgi:hypothetical protein
MKLPYLSLSLLTLSSLAAAQHATLRGKVEDVSGTTDQFIIDCANVDLTSATFDLNLFVGSHVEIQGIWDGSTTSPLVDVTAILEVPESFELGGGGKIGSPLKPSVTGTPGALAITMGAVSNAFLPLGTFGTILLGGTTFHTGSGTIPAGGTLELSIEVPNDPTLVGVDVFGQAAILDTGASTLLFTNPDCQTLSD